MTCRSPVGTGADPGGIKGGQLFQHDLPGIVLAWVTQVERLENGNTRFINCHAGPDMPHIIEVTPEKEVVWTWKDWRTFGNSVPVAVVLDA